MTEVTPLKINGRRIVTSIGSEVWVGVHKDTVCLRFTAPDKTETDLALGIEAAHALVRLCIRALPKEETGFETLVEHLGSTVAEMVRAGGFWKAVTKEAHELGKGAGDAT